MEYQNHEQIDFLSGLVLAIDPGTWESGWVLWDGNDQRVLLKGYTENVKLLGVLQELLDKYDNAIVAIEMMELYGTQYVGREVFRTVVWIGRFTEKAYHAAAECIFVYRRAWATHHTGTGKKSDARVKAVLKDKYGQPSTKDCPNTVYGGDYQDKMRKDMWEAFAIATYLTESGSPLWHLPTDRFPQRPVKRRKTVEIKDRPF